MKEYKINACDLKQYVSSMRACRYMPEGHIEMEPDGSVNFDLSSFNNITSCIIKGKRMSGNGSITIKTGDSCVNTRIVSKIEQTIIIPALNKIDIIRQPGTYGKILIHELIIQTDDNTKDNSDSEKAVASMNWRTIMAQYEPYKNVRVIKNKLFASEGGSIKSSNIESIITEPSNVFVNNNGFIKFMMPCEILEIKLSSKDKVHSSEPMYHNIEAPPPITNLDSIINTNINSNRPEKHKPTNVTNTNQLPKCVIYDSLESGLIINSLSSVVGVLSNTGNGILMRRASSFCIPISIIEPNFEYVIVATARKINGNGKLEISIISDDSTASGVTLLATHRNSELFFKLKSGKPSTNYKIKISRGPNSVGELFVERIKLIDGIKNSTDNLQNNSTDNVINTALFYKPIHFDYNTENIIQNPIILNTLNSVPLSDNINLSDSKDKKFVIVIPSYNNEKWVENNLRSAIQQNYKNYRIIYIDDCSSDNTFINARKIIDKYNGNIKTILVKNINRLGALENLYNAIHSCADDEIILTLDGDDWLSHENVLNYLNDVYKNGNVWLTYGQYQNYPNGARGISQQIPDKVIQSNGFRSFAWCSSHLRTFYAWLFKKINKNDLLYKGKFLSMTWDLIIMFPMLEMAGQHSAFVSEILYIYNLDNPINDHKVNRDLQRQLDGWARAKQKYNLIKPDNTIKPKKAKVGLIIISTGKYHEFTNPLINSADRYFLNEYDVSYFIFSDKQQNVLTNRNVTQIHIEHVQFPFATMNRFKYFTENKNIFKDMDYLYYADVDALFVNNIGDEIIGDLVGVRHCGYYHGGGTYENNSQSVHYVDPSLYKYYFAGGFNGGSKENYLKLAEWCYFKIEEDLKNNIIPRWHDESSLNRYFLDNEPTIILSPSFHYPQNIESFRHLWKSDYFEPKILLLEKYHEKVRS